MIADLASDYVVEGEAVDQETVVRLRPKIEQYMRDEEGLDFDMTDLYWEFDEGKSLFRYEIHFFKNEKI